MDRLNPFRVVGFAFLAFAALTLYQGEFQLGRSSGPIISRAQDPETYWRYVLVQFAIGFALLYLGRRSRRIESAQPSEKEAAEGLPKLPNYDPVFCGRLVKGAAYLCAGLIAAELLVLLLVHPSDEQCPNWVFHAHQPSAASMWALAGLITVLPTLWMCYVALRWDRYFASKMYDSIACGSPGQMFMPVNWLVLAVIAFWCLFCAIPLFLMLDQCTAVSAHFNLNGLQL
jgi:hypothetical protein